MSKVVTAEYDAATNALRLDEPAEGLTDHQRVRLTIDDDSVPDGEPPWMKFRGIMSKERGDDFARALEELFPPWNADE